MQSRSKAAAKEPITPIRCPPHEQYQDAAGAAWPDQPNIGLQQGDDATLAMLVKQVELGKDSQHPAFIGQKNPLGRVAMAYKLFPQSYKNKIWRTAADGIVATRYDRLLAPDSDFLPTKITQPIWPGAQDCQISCPSERDGICPWVNDCRIFYGHRKPKWDRQHDISQACHVRWIQEESRRRGEAALDARRATLAAKKEALRARMAEERKLSRMIFEPTQFPNEQEDREKIKEGFHSNQGEDPALLQAAIQQFRALSGLPPFTLLDFQCAIADYFHDGMPGFRISSTKDPKISGIRIHDIDMIRIGKGLHQDFMYLFLSHVLKTIQIYTPPRLLRIRAELIQLRPNDIKPIFTLPNTSAEDALYAWRNMIQLHGARVEDSLIPHLGLPPDEEQHVYHTSLSAVKGKNPIHSYHTYLQSGKRRITIHINKKGEVNLLTKPEAQRVVTFLLFVLFGPSYHANMAGHPAQFTFDAHKGHMNRLLAISKLPGVLRLVTPYNVADSAMTEKFKDVDPDDEALAEEIVEEEDKGASAADLEKKNKIKEEAKIEEDEEEAEDDVHAAAQKGDSRFIYAFNKGPAALPFVVSDTNMIFDDNWLIYYKNKGFTQQHPYLFSMNLVDAGLHDYIRNSGKKEIRAIPSSAYTVEAPFSTEITRGPSLNYLMMGLMRGSASRIFGKTLFDKPNDLYQSLCKIPINDNAVKELLPIYTIPASSHSLPLFQYIAKAPLFAYHMLYDLQHHLSALPSRIKWAGDREQYMAIKGLPTSVFVTLDTTGYYCALANGVPSLLERQLSMKLVGVELDAATKSEIAARAAQTPAQVVDPDPKPTGKGAQSKPAGKAAQSKHAHSAIGKDAKRKPAASKAPIMKGSASTKKSTEKGSMTNGGSYTRKNAKQSIPQSVPGREYFFLNWLYPLTMSINAVFYGHHAEHAYVLLQNLQKDLSYPLLFPALQEQLIHAVSLIPNVPKDLMDAVKNITAETYEDVAPRCLLQLKDLYTSPHLSIFSQPAHKETLLGYLREMKEKLSRRLSNDTTTTMLHLLLTPDLTPDQEKVCLVLSLLFERLHGRIQNGTSYLGQILGITGGPDLENVDDQEVWDDLTAVLEEDMAWITDLSQHVSAPVETTVSVAAPVVANAANAAASVAPIENATNAAPIAVRRISAKRRNVVRGPAFQKLNNAFSQLRRKNGPRAPTRATHASRVARDPIRAARVSRATVTQNSRRVIMGGSRKKTRRSRRSQCKD